MSKADREIIARVVAGWRDNLINLTGTNRLLNFNLSKSSSVPVTQPQFEEVIHRLSTVSGMEFVPLRLQDEEDQNAELAGNEDAEQEAIDESLNPRQTPVEMVLTERRLLGADLDRSKLSAALRNLANKSRQTYLDTGLQVLYLAIGQLKWNEPDDPKGKKSSPLILLPVDLHQNTRKSPVILTIDDFEPVLNPALILKMKLMEFDLPELDEGTPTGITKYLNELKAQVRNQPGWSVTSDVILSYFTFHKEAMYQDIEDNMETVLESELVQALALSGTDNVSDQSLFEPVAEKDIDLKDPPEKSHQVLDADASQRAAIYAASTGKSFILDGPPGTGKSQTIANIIANQIALGKKVLFVSEKIAALEVVRNRLDEVGLGSYLLELHSHKATRQAVAKELGHALKTRPTANGFMSEADAEKLQADRVALTAYAEGMNKVHESIGLSIHDAIGEVSLRADLPKVRGLSERIVDLDSKLVARIRSTASRLSRAWRPALEGDSFLWRGVKTERNLDVELERALTALDELHYLFQPYGPLAQDLGWHGPGATPHVSELLSIWASRPEGTPTSWLTSHEWANIKEASIDFANLMELIQNDRQLLQNLVGNEWVEVSAIEHGLNPNVVFQSLEKLNPAPTNLKTNRAQQIVNWISELKKIGKDVELLQEKSQLLSRELGLLQPNDLNEIREVLTVQELTESNNRPEKSWLKTEVDSEVERGINTLRNSHAVHDQAQIAALKTFTPSVLQIDPAEMISKFANQHRGLRKISSDYRSDKKILREVTQPGITTKEAIEHLPEAQAWLKAQKDLKLAQEKYSGLIGPRYQGSATDWESLTQALETARQIVRTAKTDGLDRLMANAGYGEQINHKAAALSKECRSLINNWEQFQDNVLKPMGCAKLTSSSIPDQIKWLVNVEETLSRILESILIINETSGQDLTLAQVLALIEFGESLKKHEREFSSKEELFTALLGEAFEGQKTDVSSLARKVDWTEQVLRKVNMEVEDVKSQTELPLSQLSLDELLESTPSYALSQAFRQWEECRDVVLDQFDFDLQLELIVAFSNWDDARETLKAFISDDSGQQEWLTYQECLQDLLQLGFESTLEDL